MICGVCAAKCWQCNWRNYKSGAKKWANLIKIRIKAIQESKESHLNGKSNVEFSLFLREYF